MTSQFAVLSPQESANLSASVGRRPDRCVDAEPREGSDPCQVAQAAGVAFEVGGGAGDVQVGAVGGQGLHVRCDVLQQGDELGVQAGFAAGQVEVSVEDVALPHRDHPALPGLV
jgi:hypothetical protein